MEMKEAKLHRELYQVACMIEKARTPYGMVLFSEKQFLQQELDKLWDTVGPHHPSSFQVFRLLKASEDRYKAFITGKSK
jgi:hypothetical protein